MKYIKVNVICFFFHVATAKFKTTDVAHMFFPLDSAGLEPCYFFFFFGFLKIFFF